MPRTYFHATPHDLSGQTHLLPPSRTGRTPHWDDMDPAEDDLVFMSHSLDAAHGWAGEILGEQDGPYFIYQVDPREADYLSIGGSTSSASSARIVREVFRYSGGGWA